MKKRFVLASCLALMVLTGCETVKGVSKDVHSGAETVQGWF